MAAPQSIRKTILDNGTRIVTERVPNVDSVAIGFYVLSGSVDESASNRGASHFIEHMLFKSTRRRSAAEVAAEIDAVGGNVNAVTDREYTCYYGRVVSHHLARTTRLLAELIREPRLRDADIELERNVILEEIASYEDDPDELVLDLFTEAVWVGSPLGRALLGTAEEVTRISREMLWRYLRRHYVASNLLVAATGAVDHERFVELVAPLLPPRGEPRTPRLRPPRFAPAVVLARKRSEQVHICVGTRAHNQDHPDKHVVTVIDAALSGGYSSRLFQEIRERRGLAYAIGPCSVCYKPAGYFAVEAGASLSNAETVVDLILQEFERVRREGITDEELERAQEQLCSGLLLGQESMSNRMSRLAQHEHYFQSFVPVRDVVSEVRRISRDDVVRVAEYLFDERYFSVAAVGPIGKRRPRFAARLGEVEIRE